MPYFADFRSSNHGRRRNGRFDPGSVVANHFARAALLLNGTLIFCVTLT
jgi:hypothetical protein